MTIKNTAKRVLFILAILNLSFFTLPSFVKAAGEFYCADYARTAVQQYHELVRSGCSFNQNDPKWNPDMDYHLKWCLGPKVTEAMCNGGTSQRAQVIANCKGQAFNQTLHQSCEEYAKRSVNQNISNIGNNCQFSGPEWNSDKFYHYDWCMKYKISKEDQKSYLTNRDAMLATCLPYQTMEKNEKSFVVYISNEEGRFKDYATGFINEFQKTWKLSQYYWGDCRFLDADPSTYVNSADLAFLAGHGTASSINLQPDRPCNLGDKAWGSYSSSLRTGDLEYIAFMSCKVLFVDTDGYWRGRWRHYSFTKDDNRPFSGLHMALGYRTNHTGSGILGKWEADEFAENLKDGLPVLLAWYEAVDDYRHWVPSDRNWPAIFYIRPHKDETLDEHDSRDYKYGDPEYLLDAYYATEYTTVYDFEGGLETPVPDSTLWW